MQNGLIDLAMREMISINVNRNFQSSARGVALLKFEFRKIPVAEERTEKLS